MAEIWFYQSFLGDGSTWLKYGFIRRYQGDGWTWLNMVLPGVILKFKSVVWALFRALSIIVVRIYSGTLTDRVYSGKFKGLFWYFDG